MHMPAGRATTVRPGLRHSGTVTRWFRVVLAVICGSLVMALTPAANAQDSAIAVARAVTHTEGDSTRVLLTCVGAGSAGTVRVDVTCDLYDSSGDPAISHSRAYPGAAGVCVISAFNLRLPLEYCTTAVATFADASTQSASDCQSVGSPAPPHTAGPHVPTLLECLDPAATGI
jgi:hypothetical protein